MSIDEIIAALEKATGPSRGYDVAIVQALHPDIGPYTPHCVGEEPIFWHEPYRKQAAPHFTASIDAALTLVPEGCFWLAAHGRTRPYEPLGGAQVFEGKIRRGGSAPLGEGEAATVPLALCIAALRAGQVQS